MRRMEIYDTTLRDGTQAEDFNVSVEDKVRISLKLDELGIHYIEGGWPGSNPKDVQFFKEIRNYALSSARITAFGSTHNPRNTPEQDVNLRALVEAQTEVITIFGKTWDVHVRDALRISLERNLEIIRDSVAYLRPHVKKLFYDAEHFFDGFKAQPDYALATLRQAVSAGVDCLVLCDTNGGTLPQEVAKIINKVKKEFKNVSFGIHTHNDSGLAVANSLVAAELGASQVQGTMNGYGERCGNANLCTIVPTLMLKMKIPCITDEQLTRLSEISRFITEIANLPHNKYQPYVGASAFAHKGGIHVSAVQRNPETYEHIRPEKVGNIQRILISDLSGKSNILHKAMRYGLDLESRDPVVLEILKQLKELENQGYQFEGAEASFELLMQRALGTQKKYFDLLGFRVIDQKSKEDDEAQAEATIMLGVGGKVEHTAAIGNGPVNALDNAIRKALEKFYPELKEMHLDDYKVRVIPDKTGTGARVRVLIESSDREDTWGTVGVSTDIIEASWQALVDGINYKFLKDRKKKKGLN
ncbi:MAG: citramalate synthase [Thermodesulfobacteriota bacterium]